MSKTADAICADLDALDRHVDALQAQADAIALAAVSGDDDARKSLASLLREIDQVNAERPILELAREQAQLREIEAGRAIDAADRDRHRADARESASHLLAAGKQADEMIAAFVACMDEMTAAEKAIHSSLRAAGEPMSIGIAGRYNVASVALERMKAACSGKLHFLSDQRSLTNILAVAWADLHEEDFANV